MKKYDAYKFLFLFLIIISLMQINCREKQQVDGIDIIAENDSNYLAPAETSTKPAVKEMFTVVEKVENELKPKEIFNKTGPGEFVFLYELYLNEKGVLDKVRIVQGMGEPFDKRLISLIKPWEFEPAIKNSKIVKSRLIFYSKIDFDIKGGWNIKWYFDTGNSVTTTSGDFYNTTVDEMPEFPGGTAALIKFLGENIHYPDIAKRAGIEGKVFVKAYIDETGNIAATEVLKGVGYGMDEAAIEAVKKLKFSPGRQGGKPVKVQIVIPISFKLS